jgi:alpha-L-rhamnosidase
VNRIRHAALVLLASVATSTAQDGRPNSGTILPSDLRCEYAANPLGVDTAQPRLSWKLESTARDQRQMAYHILAASSADLLAQGRGDLWDSGKVVSEESIHIRYGGQALKSSQQVFWRGRVWDQDDRPSPWSQPASWTMGVLEKNDWQAEWISAKGAQQSARTARGYHAAETRLSNDVKWVQVDLGTARPLSAIRLHPMQHAGKDGFGFPLRFKVEVASGADFAQPTLVADHTAADFANPGYHPVSFDAKGSLARFVRVTATKLWPRDWAWCFALQQIEVVAAGANVAAGAQVTARDTVEAHGWGQASLTDGLGLIGRAPAERFETMLLRREFNVKPGLRRALAQVCGLGQYELTLNERKAGDDLLAPGWSKYDKTCLYDTHDLTSLLREGRNAVGLLLGNGMYRVAGGRYTKFTGSFGPLKAIVQVRLDYADGTCEVIGTGAGWRVAPGPITFSCIFGGEDYDGRLEPRGWNQPGFDDSRWQPALVTDGPGGALRGQGSAAPPLKAIETLPPASVKALRPGIAVYDLGQNAPIMPRLRVRGPAGSTVRITPAELLKEDGSVDRGSCGGGDAYWKYTLAGAGVEPWFPKFWYHGCRYLQVERQAAVPNGELPVVEALEGVVVHSASTPVGDFACSNELFNRIRTLVRWAQRANMVSVLTDCPHRERLGWLEEYHLNGPSLRYEWDLARLFTKSMNDMADSQLPDGLVPDIAPEYTVFGGGFRDSPEWGSAFVIVPWQQYEWTGDVELLRRHYDGMERYVAYLGRKAKNHIVSHGLGDWYDLGPRPPGEAQLTPRALTATAFYYYDTWILAQAAALLGRGEDAKRYESLASEIRTAFNREFFKTDPPRFATGSQCANAIPLVVNLVDPKSRPAVLEAIVRDVRSRNNSLTAGDVGYRYLLRALSEGGRSDVIFDMNNHSDRPGYGLQLKRGATSLTEAWDAGRGSSQNHFMLGHIMEWFYHDLAGIGCDPAGPGFKRIVIKPQPVGDVTWARASYDSIRGRIMSDWRRTSDEFLLKVTIPPNATAAVFLPCSAPQSAREGGTPLAAAKGVRSVQAEKDWLIVEVGSGSYQFESRFAR